MADTKVSDLPALNGVDVDPADLLYIVDSSAGAAGSKKITVGQYQVAPYSAGTANGVMYLNGSNVVTTGSGLVFDGTDLGIGTSSPGNKLQVTNSTGVNTYAAFTNANATNGTLVGTAANGDGVIGTVDPAKPLLFLTASFERMRLDASGNLGLGVTPSASWSKRAIQFGPIGSVASDAGTTNFSSNVVFGSSSNTYITTGHASGYYQNSGQHVWITATSGTAGNAITFTQAMTLDASGRLLVGGTSALYSEKFGITATGTTSVPTSLSALNGALALISTGQASTAYGGVGYQDSGGGGAAVVFGRGTGFDTQILFCTNPGSTTTSGAMTERARITSGGDLLVGSTASTPQNTTAAAFGTGPVAGYGSTWMQIPNNAASSYKVLTFFRGSTEIGSVSYNGTGVNFNGTSDRRLKENIQPASDAGGVIAAIEIVQHDWKAGGHTRFGVIAQDLHAVAPEAVTPGDDGDEIEKTWGVDYSKLVPMLIKEVQSLRARVAALEAQ